MDIRCSHCGEPWEMDTLHDLADEENVSFDQARRMFYKDGCKALGTRHGSGHADPGVAMLQDLLGDDVDGLAAMLEDFGL